MSKEKESAGASYVISFYQEVQTLTHNYGNYTNLMLEVENKYPDVSKIEPEVRNVITATVQEVRLGVMKTYIMYRSIVNGANIKDNSLKEIETSYFNIKKTFVIPNEDLEKYVINLNAVLVNDVIQNLLATGQDLFKSVYHQ